jgi:hypothetical protein
MLAVAAGSGGTWADSFEPKTLASYLDSNGLSVMVAAAGERSGDAKEAAKALISGLRATGKTTLVTDDEALGDLSGLSDDQIVTKARSTPASVVVVIRVYPGAAGKPAGAVASFHDARSGRSLSTFSLAEGAPLGAWVAGSAAPVTASGPPVAPPPSQAPDAERAFEERGIWPEGETVVGFNRYGSEVVRIWTVFTRGRYGPVLEGADLYDYLGRADLAHSYRARRATRLGLLLGGFLVAAGGAAIFAVGFASAGPCTTIDSNTGKCTANQSGNPTLMAVGGSLAGVGIVTGLVGALIDPWPASRGETMQMIDQFNQGLRNGGASLDTHSQPESESESDGASPLPVQLGVFALPNGGGLSLAMRL